MPTPMLPGISSGMDQKQIINYLARIHKELQWLLGNLDTLNIRELNADVVNAGTLNANLVRIRSDLTSGYVQWDANGMIINNGLYNTFSVDLNGFVTLAGALIQSKPGTYPMVELNPTTNLFSAMKDASNRITINPFDVGSGSPGVFFIASNLTNGYINYNPSYGLGILSVSGQDITISAGRHLYLTSGSGFVRLQNWNSLINNQTLRTLQDDLNGKANGSGVTGVFYVSATAGGPANKFITVSNGVITSIS